jgi:hypothetical protein
VDGEMLFALFLLKSDEVKEANEAEGVKEVDY